MTSETTILFEKKKAYLENILYRLVNWDQSADSAQLIIDQNQELIEDIQKIDKCLSREDLASFTEKHRWLIEQIMTVQERMITIIKRESEILADQMKQVNRKDKVVSHYIEKEQSLFVDRDV
ncbi:hypothetical protein [Alkalibacterium olivapovliticus]|uniref:Flagellar protein FliT n=1 Tax=Alkalibacterium olivapovliticus TaxID=99907 RepID=A0A2T0VYS8_9LACT|nr:hypothetical protein [Alkalibacterium olivapovliticus]PRY77495.1 hypothetical protein CLV38_1288 [Alkalibacterium olivapovliticus]